MANIGKSISIKGNLTGNEDLVVEGRVEGRIELANNQLTIGPEGRVQAELHAKSVIVVGHVRGNITASERVQVQSTGVVEGDLMAPRIAVEEGAVIEGSILMDAQRSARAEKPGALARAASGGGGRPE